MLGLGGGEGMSASPTWVLPLLGQGSQGLTTEA